MKMFDWLFPAPTPDEALIAELKSHVEAVQALGAEADRRRITVWLRDKGYKGGIILPKDLSFDEAYKTSRRQIA